MGTINDLNTTDSLVDDDKLVLWKEQAGATRAITAANAARYFATELSGDYQPLDPTLTMYAALGMTARKIVRGIGTDTAELIHFSDYINVLDYGATGNGTTDDTAAIQSAITAANATTHKRLYFPAGTYKYTAQLIWHDGATWFGDGAERSVLKMDSSMGNVVAIRTNTTSNILNAKAVTSVTSSSTTATVTTTAAHGYSTGDFVNIVGATQVEYNGSYEITVTGASTFTYTFRGSATTPATGTITCVAKAYMQSSLTLSDLHFQGFYSVLTATPPYVTMARAFSIENLLVQNCKFSDANFFPISFGGVKNFRLLNSEFVNFGHAPDGDAGGAWWLSSNPLDNTPNENVLISGNYVHDGLAAAYLVGKNLQVLNNTFQNIQEGLYNRRLDLGGPSFDTDRFVFAFNTVDTVTPNWVQAAGIELGAKSAIIAHNTFKGCKGPGVDITDVCEDVLVHGNQFIDCATQVGPTPDGSSLITQAGSIWVRSTSYTTNVPAGIKIIGNTIRSSAGNYGIRLYDTASGIFSKVIVRDNDLVGSASNVDNYLLYDASDLGADVVIENNLGAADWRAGFVNVRDFGARGDGTTDDYAAINKALTVMAARGGGRIVFPVGTYLCNTGLTIPKNANVRLEGERIVTAAAVSANSTYAGSVLKAGAGVTTLITWNGDASVTVSQTELASGLHIDSLVLEGNGSTTTHLIDSLNSAFLTVDHCRLISSTNCIRATFNGTYTGLLLAGGMRISNCTFGPLTGGVAIEIDGHTQDWITRNWFAGTAASVQIKINRSNKVNTIDNEFNASTGNVIFELSDDTGEATQDIVIVGSKINAGGADLFSDTRADSSSKRVVFVGNSVIGAAAFDPSTLHNPASNIFSYTEDSTSKFYGEEATFGTMTATTGNADTFNADAFVLNDANGAVKVGSTNILRSVSGSWTPTITSSSGTLTTVSASTARYQRTGPFVTFTIVIVITDNGTGAGTLRFTLPTTPVYAGAAVGFNTINSDLLSATWTTTTTVDVVDYSGAYPVTTGDTIRISGVYLVG